MTYQWQYFTITSRISECDHKGETRNAEPEIGIDGSSQIQRNPRVDRYGSGFGPPRVCGLGFLMVLEPNRPVFVVQTWTAGGLPGTVANTNDTWIIHLRCNISHVLCRMLYCFLCLHGEYAVSADASKIFSGKCGVKI